MKKAANNSFFKTGIWIKEQQGNLTIGSLDENDKNIKVIPDGLSKTLQEFEKDMIDALYGESSIPYIPGSIDVKKLFSKIETAFHDKRIRLSVSGTENNIFKGEFDKIFTLLERFVLSSLDETSNASDPPTIYINASLLEKHLCIIYRDSHSACHPSKLKKEIQYITKKLNGEVSYKSTGGEKSYFDIMIPSKDE